MAIDVNDLQSRRFKFLHAIYTQSGGDEDNYVSLYEICTHLGYDKPEAFRIMQYLDGEGLAEIQTLDGDIQIKHRGIIEVERALSTPKERTQYFPPVINILNVNSMHGSQIQQGTQHSTQTGTFTVNFKDVAELRDLMERIKSELPNIKTISNEDRQEGILYVEGVIKCIDLPKPNPGFILKTLISLKEVFAKGVADVSGAAIFALLKEWLASHGVSV